MRSRVGLAVLALCAAMVVVAPTVSARGGAAACTIVGTVWNDDIVGTPGPDVICGLGGDDRIKGAGGADVLRGGPGQDVLRGGPGADLLRGGPGGDDLLDTTVRVRDGGPGADFCPGAAGRRVSCVDEDSRDPVLTKEAVSPLTVHLVATDATVVATVSLRDDVGIRYVDLQLYGDAARLPLEDEDARARRIGGTVRDGVYRTRIRVPAHVQSGSYQLSILATPREGDRAWMFGGHVRIDTDDPDTTPPVLVAVTKPGPAVTYHLDQRPVVRLRASDDLAGVRVVSVCYGPSLDPRVTFCDPATRIAGWPVDGFWRARLTHLADLGVGAGELSVRLDDDAGSWSQWFGPSRAGDPTVDHIPGGVGGFTVVP